MRFCLLISSLALFRVALLIGDENLFSDGIYEPIDEWMTEPSLGIGFEPRFWNLDHGQLTQDTNSNLVFLLINDESSTDFWASCSPGGLQT